jgi:predicted O-methyltransferase YrrM
MVTKAARLGRGVAADGARYPALRARVVTERTPAGALAEFGFPGDELDALERDYASVAAEMFPRLLERAREVGAPVPAAKLARPELPAHDAKKLLYLAVRLAGPEVVVETGTFNGTYSTFILLALRDNGRGRLVSLDLPARTPIPNAIDHPLPPECEPGWIIPDELRERFELVVGDARRTLPPVLERLGGIDLFFHDSLHTTRHMLFEYRRAWLALRPGGLLLSDDAFMTPAFWWFTRRRRVPLFHAGAVGVTRKP